MDSATTPWAELVAIVEANDLVDVRLALTRDDAGAWLVRFGEVLLDPVAPAGDRAWWYPQDALLERRLPGPVVAGLMRQQPQLVDDRRISAPAPQNAARSERLPSQATWNHTVTPWPRTEWEIGWEEQTPSTRPRTVLVGDGPGFLDTTAAFCAFFHAAASDTNLDQSHRLWRVMRPDRRSWVHRVTIAPDALTVTVKGTDLTGVRAELSAPTGRVTRPVGRTGRVRLRLPHGLVPGTLLLRTDDDWRDLRYFPSATPGQATDQSVVWDLPGAHVGVLIAGGESQYVEFKREVPTAGESRRNMLKTIAAFASGEGGTVLVGVEDDTRVVGVDATALDPLMRQLTSMIRDSIAPEPPYTVRAEQVDGKTVLLVEVSGGGGWHAYSHTKPEFYLRRGASTVPARVHEIAVGFGAGQQLPRMW